MKSNVWEATQSSRPSGEASEDQPNWTLVVQAGGPSTALHLSRLWTYRGLLYFLAWRDVKVRYKQSLLGAGWAVLKPFVSMVVFSVIFGYFARIPSGGVAYPIFSYTALLLWTLFAAILGQSSASLVLNANLISKIYFPRLIIPLSTCLVALLDFSIAFVVLIGMMAFYGVRPSPALVLAPAFVLLAVVAGLSVGVWLSALTVRYRDVGQITPFLVQLWMYLTPVVYPVTMIHGPLRTLLVLNPMSGVTEGFRWAVLGGRSLDVTSVIVSAVVSLVVLVSGLFYFRSVEQSFADVV